MVCVALAGKLPHTLGKVRAGPEGPMGQATVRGSLSHLPQLAPLGLRKVPFLNPHPHPSCGPRQLADNKPQPRMGGWGGKGPISLTVPWKETASCWLHLWPPSSADGRNSCWGHPEQRLARKSGSLRASRTRRGKVIDKKGKRLWGPLREVGTQSPETM